MADWKLVCMEAAVAIRRAPRNGAVAALRILEAAIYGEDEET